MFNPWILLAVGAGWLASLAAVGWWQHNAGAAGEKVRWEARETEIVTNANAKIIAAETRARQTEQNAALAIGAVGAKLEEVKANVLLERDRIIAASRAGTIKLRVPVTSCPSPNRNPTSAVAASPSNSDVVAPTRLYAEVDAATTDALIGLAADADGLVAQLTAAQAVIIEDRKVCNGS